MRRIVTLLAAFVLSAITLPSSAQTAPAEFSGLVNAHNQARRAVGVAPLAWSPALAAEAQQWAEQLTREGCKLRHDPDPQRRETTGQNLFRAFSSAPYEGYKRSSEQASARWISEGQSYNHSTHQCQPGLASECGAYLQVIWEATTGIGCGRARCEAAEVWACHYAPRGGQEGLLPFGNPVQQSPVVEVAPPVQQCGWQGKTPADYFSEALTEQLSPQ